MVMQDIASTRRASPVMLSFSELFNASNRVGSDYRQTLLKLTCIAAQRGVLQAARLDRAAEVDPYESGHTVT